MNDDSVEAFPGSKDQRRTERVPLMLEISVSIGALVNKALLLNISGEGAKVQVPSLSDADCGPGSEAEIIVPRFGSLSGSIVWIDDIFFGMEFDENHKVTAMLIEEMALASKG